MGMQTNPYESSTVRDDATPARTSWSRILGHVLVAGIVPFFVELAYVLHVELLGFDPQIVHPTLPFACGILVAVGALATLPVNVPLRVLLILAWVPLLGVMLFHYRFIFVGAVSGRWM